MERTIRRWEDEFAFDGRLFLHAFGGAAGNAIFYVAWATYWLPAGDEARRLGLRALLDPSIAIALVPIVIGATALAFYAGRFLLRRTNLRVSGFLVHGAVSGVIAAGTPVLHWRVIPIAVVAMISAMVLCRLTMDRSDPSKR
ncbi:MAG: hypothetical protein ACKVWV_18660 [Planctomycetota bacterium]